MSKCDEFLNCGLNIPLIPRNTEYYDEKYPILIKNHKLSHLKDKVKNGDDLLREIQQQYDSQIDEFTDTAKAQSVDLGIFEKNKQIISKIQHDMMEVQCSTGMTRTDIPDLNQLCIICNDDEPVMNFPSFNIGQACFNTVVQCGHFDELYKEGSSLQRTPRAGELIMMF